MTDKYVMNTPLKEEWLDGVVQEEGPKCDVTLQVFDEPYNPPAHSMFGIPASIPRAEGDFEAIMSVSAESFDVSSHAKSMRVAGRSRESCFRHDKLKLEDNGGGSGITNTILENGYSNHEPHKKTQVVDEDKPFACALCHYRCGNAYHLKRHVMTHTGEKPFSCRFCDYKSYRADKVKRHARTHTGEKPFACLYCDYRANRADHLTAHLRSHSRKQI